MASASRKTGRNQITSSLPTIRPRPHKISLLAFCVEKSSDAEIAALCRRGDTISGSICQGLYGHDGLAAK